MTRQIKLIMKSVKRYGISSALSILCLKIINKIVTLKVLRCVALTHSNMAPSDNNTDLRLEFLNQEQVEKYFGKGFNDLDEKFYKVAVAKGDISLVILNNKKEIVGYSWFSNQDSDTGLYGLDFTFDPSYVYTYKVYVRPEDRGKKLHARQMTFALSNFMKQGYKGIICYIYSDNFASLKSSYRMGFRNIGSVYIIKFFGKVFHVSWGLSKEYNISLKKQKGTYEEHSFNNCTEQVLGRN